VKTLFRRVSWSPRNETPLHIPLAWIMDGTQDCIDGTDEDITIWGKSCINGANRKFIPNEYDCKIFTKFICHKSGDQIDISSVCRKSVSISANKTVHKNIKCESEQRMCQQSKDLPRILTTTIKHRKDNNRVYLLHCLPGLGTLQMYLGRCVEQVFHSKTTQSMEYQTRT
jgi:hypothetical protein